MDITPHNHSNGNDIRLLAFDLDGTILERGEHIAPEFCRALARVAAAGVRCATATGRPLEFQLEVLARHGLGAQAGLPHALIADERALYLLEDGAYRAHTSWNETICAAWEELRPVALAWLARAQARALAWGYQVPYVCNPEEARVRGAAALRLPSRDAAERVRAWLAEELAARGLPLAVNRNYWLVQVYPTCAGKGHVLAELARLWSIPPCQVLAVGDSLNDFCMLDGRLGFRCATVANADPTILDVVAAQGGHVASLHCAQGVVEVLTALLPCDPCAMDHSLVNGRDAGDTENETAKRAA